MDLSTDEKRRIWEALLDHSDAYAWSDSVIPPVDNTLYFDGYLRLEGLLKVAEVIAAIKTAQAHT